MQPTDYAAQAPSAMRRSSRQSRTTRQFAHGSAIAATNSGTSPHSAAPQLSAAAARPPNTRQSRSARRFTEWFGRSAPTVMVQTLSCGQHAVDAGQIGLSKPAAGIHQLPGKRRPFLRKGEEAPETTSPPKLPRGSAATSYSADPLPPREETPRRLALNSPPNDPSPILEHKEEKQLIDIVLRFDVELDVIAIQEVNNGEKMPPFQLGMLPAGSVRRPNSYFHSQATRGPEGM
ncbi:hypothetical protein E4U38_004975 [Claviceps purpurea]|nr:hypothetical protein E4U38_004975 [Claviceps purpurea]